MNATVNTPNTPAPVSTRTVIESNHMGGRWIDRLYKLGTTDAVELINKDSTLTRHDKASLQLKSNKRQDKN